MYYKLIFIFVLLIFKITFSQEVGWHEELSKDGTVEIRSRVYETKNETGKEITLIEYSAKTTTTASIEKCSEIFNNPEMHKKFYEYTEQSKKIKDVSENEWIIYYYYSPPWPIVDSDCVSRITITNDSLNKKVTFTSFSEADLIEMKDVIRSELNDITFTFKQINDQQTEIFIEAKLIPDMAAPKWMMKGWFPKGPARTLNRFKELAEQK